MFQDHVFPYNKSFLEGSRKEVLGLTTAWLEGLASWQHHTVLFQFLVDSNCVTFPKLSVELQKENAVSTTLYQLFSKLQYCSPFSSGCML